MYGQVMGIWWEYNEGGVLWSSILAYSGTISETYSTFVYVKYSILSSSPIVHQESKWTNHHTVILKIRYFDDLKKGETRSPVSYGDQNWM